MKEEKPFYQDSSMGLGFLNLTSYLAQALRHKFCMQRGFPSPFMFIHIKVVLDVDLAVYLNH